MKSSFTLPLVAAYGRMDRRARVRVLKLFGTHTPAVPMLDVVLRALAAPQDDVREAAAQSLLALSRPSVVPTLTKRDFDLTSATASWPTLGRAAAGALLYAVMDEQGLNGPENVYDRLPCQRFLMPPLAQVRLCECRSMWQDVPAGRLAVILCLSVVEPISPERLAVLTEMAQGDPCPNFRVIGERAHRRLYRLGCDRRSQERRHVDPAAVASAAIVKEDIASEQELEEDDEENTDL